ncbi:PemK [Mycolicibacter sinensis]|uniref:PemK n=2 Tax=Mycolicibacter sinensis (strain JDM601) TaxID=875328 RepID=F5YW12_MYCSD|nr:PemK [Mycolicibacter sinensis]
MLVDQIRSIDTHYVVGDPVDYLTRDQLVEVELALVHYLGVQEAIPPRSS